MAYAVSCCKDEDIHGQAGAGPGGAKMHGGFKHGIMELCHNFVSWPLSAQAMASQAPSGIVKLSIDTKRLVLLSFTGRCCGGRLKLQQPIIGASQHGLPGCAGTKAMQIGQAQQPES